MEMREIINIIEEQQMIAELLAEKKLGKLGKAMATIGAIGSLATATPGVAGDEVAYDSPVDSNNSTSSAVKVADAPGEVDIDKIAKKYSGPGEVAPVDPSADDNAPPEVAPSQVMKNANGILVMKDGSPLDYDSWEDRVARADGMSLETTPLDKMKQAYLTYVKSVKA